MIGVTQSKMDALRNNANYQAIFQEADLATLIPASSIKRNNWTITKDVPSLAGQVLPGVRAFAGTLENYGVRVIGTGCANQVACSDPAGTRRGDACLAGNRLTQDKKVQACPIPCAASRIAWTRRATLRRLSARVLLSALPPS